MKARTIVAAMAATILATLSGGAAAQNYPKRPVEMVIPFGVGGASDIFARQYSQIAEKYLGKPLVAVNKGGGRHHRRLAARVWSPSRRVHHSGDNAVTSDRRGPEQEFGQVP